MRFTALALFIFISIFLSQGCSSTHNITNKEIKSVLNIKTNPDISPIQLAKKINPELKKVGTVFQVGRITYKGFFNPTNLPRRFINSEKPYNLIGIFKNYCENNGGFFVYKSYSGGNIEVLSANITPKSFKNLCESRLKRTFPKYELPPGYIKKRWYCYDSLYPSLLIESIHKDLDNFLSQHIRKVIGNIYGNLKNTYTFACMDKEKSFLLLAKEKMINYDLRYMDVYLDVSPSIISRISTYTQQAKQNITKTLDKYLSDKINKEIQNKIFGFPIDKGSPIEYVVLDTPDADLIRNLKHISYKSYLTIYINNKSNSPVILKLFDSLFIKKNNKTYGLLYQIRTKDKTVIADTSPNLNLEPNNKILINPDTRGSITVPIKISSIRYNDLDGTILIVNNYRFLLKKPIKDKK